MCSSPVQTINMNKYYLSCFIRQHPPKPDQEDTTCWFKQIVGIFRNEIPGTLVEHIVAMSLSENNLVLAKLVTEYLEARALVLARKKQDDLDWEKRYMAYITRRDVGNVKAHEAQIANDVQAKMATLASMVSMASMASNANADADESDESDEKIQGGASSWEPRMKDILFTTVDQENTDSFIV